VVYDARDEEPGADHESAEVSANTSPTDLIGLWCRLESLANGDAPPLLVLILSIREDGQVQEYPLPLVQASAVAAAITQLVTAALEERAR
jgi:hypothetical protein